MYTIVLTVTDSLSQSATDTVTVTVLNANDPPKLAAGISTSVNVPENYNHRPYTTPSRSLSVNSNCFEGVALVVS